MGLYRELATAAIRPHSQKMGIIVGRGNPNDPMSAYRESPHKLPNRNARTAKRLRFVETLMSFMFTVLRV